MDASKIIQAYIFLMIGAYGIVSLKNQPEESWTPVLVNRHYEELEQVRGQISEPIDLRQASTPAVEQIEKGKQLYVANCQFCHGESGLGDGAAGQAMDPKPRNFTVDAGWINGKGFEGMYKSLQHGAGQGMAAYDTMAPEDRIAIIHYVREELMGSNKPEISQAELDSLDQAYKLSEGIKEPSQIPVRKAMEVLISENSAYLEQEEALVERLLTGEGRYGYSVFSEVTEDVREAVRLLEQDGGWRYGPDYLVELVARNPAQNGFKPTVLLLSRDKLRKLHGYLLSSMSGV